MAAIKECGTTLDLTVERDPTVSLPKPGGSWNRTVGGCSLALLLCTLAAGSVDLESWLPAFSTEEASGALEAQTRALNDDGTALHPYAFAAALRTQEEVMQRMRKDKPEWAAVVDAEELDVPRFQEILKHDTLARKVRPNSRVVMQ